MRWCGGAHELAVAGFESFLKFLEGHLPPPHFQERTDNVSHHVMEKPITFKKKREGKVLTTWVPHHNEITAFVLSYIIKQSEKSVEEFV